MMADRIMNKDRVVVKSRLNKIRTLISCFVNTGIGACPLLCTAKYKACIQDLVLNFCRKGTMKSRRQVKVSGLKGKVQKLTVSEEKTDKDKTTVA